MGTPTLTSMKVFILAALVAVSAARPRFLVIPIEDVDFEGSRGQLPVYRMPQLARQARMAQEEQDSFQSNPYEEQRQYAQSRGFGSADQSSRWSILPRMPPSITFTTSSPQLLF